MIDKNKIAFWKDLPKSKTTISLNDLQALNESMNEGKGIVAVDYFIKSQREIKLYDSTFKIDLNTSYLITELEDGDKEKVYLVSIFLHKDSIAAHYVYYSPNEYPSLFKKDLIENGTLWMFDDPGIPNFQASDLNYSIYPALPPFVEDGVEIPVTYKMIDNCANFGIEIQVKSNEWVNKVPVMIVEYNQEVEDGGTEYKNPYILIMEENYLDDNGVPKQQGGYVTILFGCEIQESEIEVLD